MRNIITKKRLDKYAQLQKLIRKDPQYVLCQLLHGKQKAYVPHLWKLIGNYIYSSKYFKKLLWAKIGKCYHNHNVYNLTIYSSWLGTIIKWDSDVLFHGSKASTTYFLTDKQEWPAYSPVWKLN